MHKECYFDDETLCLNELFRDDLVSYTPSLKHVEIFNEDGRVDSELLLLDKKFEKEFNEPHEKIFLEEHKVSSNHVEGIESIPKATLGRNHLT